MNDFAKRLKALRATLAHQTTQVRHTRTDIRVLEDALRISKGEPKPLRHGSKLIHLCHKLLKEGWLTNRELAERAIAAGYPAPKGLQGLMGTIRQTLKLRPDLFTWDGDTERWIRNTSTIRKRPPTLPSP